MGITSSNKEFSATQIGCNESFKIKLSISAAPDVISNPSDIALVLDRSGSMTGAPLTELKNGANEFIDLIDKNTDSSVDGVIGNGNRIGIVSFASTATIDCGLTDSVSKLKSTVNSLASGGITNHKDAFIKALSLLDTTSTNEKVLIIFTDGDSKPGAEGFDVADLAKSKGITIYSIAYGTSKTLDIGALHRWASTPSSAYTLITPTSAGITDMFENLARNVAKSGASNIMINDKISDCFKIISLDTPSKGTASMIDENNVKWDVGSLGETTFEGAEFEFTVQHKGSCTGDVFPNEAIDYSDDENNVVNFPNPKINIVCDNPQIVEECPLPFDITVGGCDDYVDYDAKDITMDSLGRVLQLSVTLKNVCPNKRVALAVIVTESDLAGNEYSRGMKTMLIPAHSESSCRDIRVRCIKFVLPEELDVSGSENSLCNSRTFKARFIANYVDTDYYCCEDNI